jgi:hypothetical protein
MTRITARIIWIIWVASVISVTRIIRVLFIRVVRIIMVKIIRGFWVIRFTKVITDAKDERREHGKHRGIHYAPQRCLSYYGDEGY